MDRLGERINRLTLVRLPDDSLILLVEAKKAYSQGNHTRAFALTNIIERKHVDEIENNKN